MNVYIISTLILTLLVLAVIIDPLELWAPSQTDTTPDVSSSETATSTTSPTAEPAVEMPDNPLITLISPTPNATIESPLRIAGEARGQWYFEATFPIILTNWDGLIIAEHYAPASGTWMTEDFVPFTAELEFESPYAAGDPDFMQRGFLILQKANPSGLPEHDDAIEIPVQFAPAE